MPDAKKTNAKSTNPENPAAERLQKIIARAGLASRRAAEQMIADGKVSVNGHIITELGAKADVSADRIVVEGRPLQMPSGPATVVLLHKPKGFMTTRHDPEGRPIVFDLLPKNYQNLHTIGRLDYDTAGVLLLTDDGELTHALTHPSHQIEKVYEARVRGRVEEKVVALLRRGVRLDDGPTAPCHIRVRATTERNTLLEISLREGRNRQVRRMMEGVGHPVSSLRRSGFAGVELEGLPVGEHRELLPAEVHQIRKLLAKKPRPIVVKTPREKPAPAGKPTSSTRKPAAKGYGSTAKARDNNKRGASALAGRIEKKWHEK